MASRISVSHKTHSLRGWSDVRAIKAVMGRDSRPGRAHGARTSAGVFVAVGGDHVDLGEVRARAFNRCAIEFVALALDAQTPLATMAAAMRASRGNIAVFVTDMGEGLPATGTTPCR